jgi:serine/threonine-protein kinase
MVPEVTAGPPAEQSDAATKRAAALIGRTLSERYRIVSLVAMGAMGAIYLAEHRLMRKRVAVKVLHPDVEGFPELVARFEREAVAGAHIQHPNVATASDFGKFDGGSAFLVLEYIEGINLRELMDRGPVPPKRATSIIRQVAAGLSAVHDKGITHRDIKPKNVMIVENARPRERESGRTFDVFEDMVKLIDFGLAKVPIDELSPIARDEDSIRKELTEAGVVMGTFGYLAPEAALGTRSILPPADQYALGVVFFEMLCGKPLFEGTEPARVFQQHRQAPVPALREKNPAVDVPLEIEAIVRRMLAKDPEERYPSAGALVTALDDVLGKIWGLAAPAPVERGSPTPEPTTGKSRRGLWIGAAIFLVTAIATATVAIRMGGKEETVATAGSVASSASSAPSAEPPPRAPPPHAPDALERLRAAGEGEAGAAVTVLIGIADAEPRAFADRAVQTEAAGILEAAVSKGVPTDAAFERLSGALGSDGVDVLYDLMARAQRGADPLGKPTSAGGKARALLARPEVLSRGTPAMRVAYDLRRAACLQRPLLFARAGKDGDDRALELLRSIAPPGCTKRDPCCFEKNRQLDLAIADIQSRLRH